MILTCTIIFYIVTEKSAFVKRKKTLAEASPLLETKKVEVKLRLTIVSKGICRFHIICMYYVLNDSHKEKTSISKGLFVTPLYLLSAKTFLFWPAIVVVSKT